MSDDECYGSRASQSSSHQIVSLCEMPTVNCVRREFGAGVHAGRRHARGGQRRMTVRNEVPRCSW